DAPDVCSRTGIRSEPRSANAAATATARTPNKMSTRNGERMGGSVVDRGGCAHGHDPLHFTGNPAGVCGFLIHRARPPSRLRDVGPPSRVVIGTLVLSGAMLLASAASAAPSSAGSPVAHPAAARPSSAASNSTRRVTHVSGARHHRRTHPYGWVP